MDNKSDDQLIITQATIEANRQVYDDKMKKLTADLTEMITSMMDQIIISKSSLDRKDPPKDKDPTTVVPANKRYQPLEVGNCTNIGGMWNIEHEISSPKFYELLIGT